VTAMRNPETMTRAEIRAELADLSKTWDSLRASVEEDGGSGGSPGEWIIERMDWLETALKRRSHL